jgi:hypothetical protein
MVPNHTIENSVDLRNQATPFVYVFSLVLIMVVFRKVYVYLRHHNDVKDEALQDMF